MPVILTTFMASGTQAVGSDQSAALSILPLDGAAPPDPWFLDDLVGCAGKVLARSGNGDLVFVGRSVDSGLTPHLLARRDQPAVLVDVVDGGAAFPGLVVLVIPTLEDEWID